MVGKLSNKHNLHGAPLNLQTTCENGLSTGQIGGLIIEMNAILHDELYPSGRKDKIHQFGDIWGGIQGLLYAEAISAAQDFAKVACDLSIKQHAPSYAAVTKAGLSSPPTTCIQLVCHSPCRFVLIYTWF